MASTKAMLSTAASLAASAMLVRTIVHDFLPHEIQSYALSGIAAVFGRFSSDVTIVVEEFDGFSANKIYRAAEVYLGTRIPPSTRRLKVCKREGDKTMEVTVERGEVVVDVFEGVQFTWRLVSRQHPHETFRGPQRGSGVTYVGPTFESESRHFELSCHKKHKSKALDAYLAHVLEVAETKTAEAKALKLHTARYDRMTFGDFGMDLWIPVNLEHPATFETLAMEDELKRSVMEDLERFVKRKSYYRRVGKAWKRGYLLYGPPGTGKSSLIAAMANYLRFDVYDLELSEIRSNSVLRKLLVATANRSILVVEDIDCSIDLENRKAAAQDPADRRYREEGVTLSGLLNFVDGLWSSCGDERIIVFTTNHKERLDSALLRPGRMDLHIHMGYCRSHGFRTLASNYHGDVARAHPLFGKIDCLLREVDATPAEVAGELMKSDDAQVTFEGLVSFLERKKVEAAETGEELGACGGSSKEEAAGQEEEDKVASQAEDSHGDGSQMK